jgi:hypothetical protein
MAFTETFSRDVVAADRWADSNIFLLEFHVKDSTTGQVVRSVVFTGPVSGTVDDGSGNQVPAPVVDNLGRVAYAVVPQSLVDAYVVFKTQFDALEAQILADNKCAP